MTAAAAEAWGGEPSQVAEQRPSLGWGGAPLSAYSPELALLDAWGPPFPAPMSGTLGSH